LLYDVVSCLDRLKKLNPPVGIFGFTPATQDDLSKL